LPEPLPTPCDEIDHLPLSGKWRDLTDPVREGSQLAGLLREALQRVNDGVRAAFVLCDLAELPAKEAATLLQTSPREVRQRVHRSRLLLIRVLDGFFQDLAA
jgi:DNA-directed RNA polymerase specialized sigma24 family protein